MLEEPVLSSPGHQEAASADRRGGAESRRHQRIIIVVARGTGHAQQGRGGIATRGPTDNLDRVGLLHIAIRQTIVARGVGKADIHVIEVPGDLRRGGSAGGGNRVIAVKRGRSLVPATMSFTNPAT